MPLPGSSVPHRSLIRRQIRRLRRHLPLIGWIVFASLIPPTVFAGIVYYEDMRQARKSLEAATELGTRRIDMLLATGRQLLEDVAQTVDINDPKAEETLEKLVYDSPLFREIGIIDEQGFLVLTSLGKVEPPVWIKPEHRPSPERAEVQILGPVQTAVMQEKSIILGLPTQGLGEVNALVNPIILTDPWGCVLSGSLGQDGFFAYVHLTTGQILASKGTVPPLEALHQNPPAHRLRVTQTSQTGEVLVIGEIAKSSVLSKWRRLLWVGGPITGLTSGLLVFLSTQMLRRSEGLDRELIIGLDNHELVIHYQPIIHLPTGTCVGSEALLRWYHPEQGVLAPNLFIPVAEQTGLINQIADWAVKQIAYEHITLYTRSPDLYTSINISPHQIHSGGLEQLLAWLQNNPFCQPYRFLFEVTETATVMGGGRNTTTADTLARLRTIGARIALDDFGQGYSGLSYLHQLDVDVLKIDQLYVSAINRDPQLTSILESIIELGQKLGFTLVAEGIETEEQRQFLNQHGVEYGQGWFFSRPLPIQEYEQFLTSHLRNLTP
jgi:sensor c-di-GMP phosphodiesterase-like protein